ncbi:MULTISPECIES: helix-turn-helix transcriptional regulator [unclassified Adlercreutzia]|uniref:helix-turn-helix transcriptional regulator n=1 Tax=unclassified Adlercreutzia TaxID=2636013 RepID=UPI001F1524B8|nr:MULTISPECIES: helix-turn-helix transcriptional regulator [unclassified Adlercreutzia]
MTLSVLRVKLSGFGRWFAPCFLGRNAKYVGERLYISEHTVRSHIYRIYQKMDVHSQQELLDVIDNEKRP